MPHPTSILLESLLAKRSQRSSSERERSYGSLPEPIPQDGQNGRLSSPAHPGAPRRALSQARPQANQNRRRYRPHFVRPFASIMVLGERKNPLSTSGFRESQSVR